MRTINIREETEKLNIWVAYFNLENQYGNPPEVTLDLQIHLSIMSFLTKLVLATITSIGMLFQEAVQKVFQRALQYCDPKKVHFALLGMYERTEQHKLAEELLDKMSKKFKHSCKVFHVFLCLFLSEI